MREQTLSRRELITGAWLRCRPVAGTRKSTRIKPGSTSGPARILIFDCIAHQGGQCYTCRERCPVPGAIATDNNRPRIVPERCTTCGICQQTCPAPRNAILILPTLGGG